MLSDNYTSFIYVVNGESIQESPKKIFLTDEVYLIIDKNLKMIWIWAGDKSRLFHRYIASSWAGKLKSKKKFYNFDYELVKQGREPEDFLIIYDEINDGRFDLKYPGESRKFMVKGKKINPKNITMQKEKKLNGSQKSRISKIIAEINEMQAHIKYSMDHIKKRLDEIEKIVE
ncbi:MAG: hypothetical protein GF317_06745 [Candidatus Lokiarchaeota archaeon]|nr:hypothetical protein [Candidatus Lokiarchaeota archaeon]MBD3199407.1 hypothetical protein [Candidatus Lokiarchaeota archaeon]